MWWLMLGCGAKAPADGAAPGSLAAKVDQAVVLDGELAKLPLAHPSQRGPGPGVELYVDVPDGDATAQIVVVTPADPGCAGPVTVAGTLERVDLGGPEGTPQSYRGWVIRNATVTCR